jgi:hypothetical protein
MHRTVGIQVERRLENREFFSNLKVIELIGLSADRHIENACPAL